MIWLLSRKGGVLKDTDSICGLFVDINFISPHKNILGTPDLTVIDAFSDFKSTNTCSFGRSFHLLAQTKNRHYQH